MEGYTEDYSEDYLEDFDAASEEGAQEEGQEMFEHFRFVVDGGQTPLRVDKYLASRMEHSSRHRIQLAIKQGFVRNNDKTVKANAIVRPGDTVTFVMPYERRGVEILPENIPLDIVYEDDDLLVINKPAGMVVHPGHGHFSGTLVNALAYHLGITPDGSPLDRATALPPETVDDNPETGADNPETVDDNPETVDGGPETTTDNEFGSGDNSPETIGDDTKTGADSPETVGRRRTEGTTDGERLGLLVHRIDKDTSGLLVVAKTEAAQIDLARQFFVHSIERRYVAVVWGNLRDDEGTIDANIARDPADRLRFKAFPDGECGKTAVTHYRVLERFGYVTVVECRLETGRTHQIRVHFNYIGHPLFNDERYGGSEIREGTIYAKYRQFIRNCFKILPRQALHAKTLGFVHPSTGKFMQFDSEIPADMGDLIKKWRVYSGNMPAEDDE